MESVSEAKALGKGVRLPQAVSLPVTQAANENSKASRFIIYISLLSVHALGFSSVTFGCLAERCLVAPGECGCGLGWDMKDASNSQHGEELTIGGMNLRY